MSDDSKEHLYGRPYAEYMQFDLASVYEGIEADLTDEERRETGKHFIIEEWSTADPSVLLPSAEDALERIMDWYVVDEVVGSVIEHWAAAASGVAVIAAMKAALDLLADNVDGRMADSHLRNIKITWDEDGEPLADGERIYREARS